MTSLQQLKDYRDHPSYSQSELKAMLSGKSYTKKPSLTMLIGSYVDCVITCSHLKDELFYICDVERPTQKIEELCESLYQWMWNGALLFEEGNIKLPTNLEECSSIVEQWIQFQDYYSNRPKTRVEKFIKEAKEWWSVLVQKGDRQIITTMEELETELILLNLQDDLRWGWISKGEFQKDFYWEEQGVLCKGLGDICFEDVYIDLKYTTCPNLNEWMKVCTNLNYPFQMAFYKSGLGFKKGYWLVVSKDWHQLVPVSDLMFTIGKYGYRKKETIRTGDKEFNIINKTPGYLDGLNLLKGEREKTIEQLYLECL
jgi:hypothetical protein